MAHNKPVILLNIAGFYAPLLELFEKMIAGGFAKPKTRLSYTVADRVGDAMAALRQEFAAPTPLATATSSL